MRAQEIGRLAPHTKALAAGLVAVIFQQPARARTPGRQRRDSCLLLGVGRVSPPIPEGADTLVNGTALLLGKLVADLICQAAICCV